MELLECTTCKKLKPSDQYFKSKVARGFQYNCKSCSKSAVAERRKLDPKTLPDRKCRECGLIKQATEYYTPLMYTCKVCKSQFRSKYPELAVRYARATKLARYGLTNDTYNTLLKSQQYCCAICKSTTPGGAYSNFHVDHCHKTGKVRGLLCLKCNVGIGSLQDSPVLLENAIIYLNKGD